MMPLIGVVIIERDNDYQGVIQRLTKASLSSTDIIEGYVIFLRIYLCLTRSNGQPLLSSF